MSSDDRTVLAFDFGLRQIGVAVGNCLLGTTQPLSILKARDGQPDWQADEASVLSPEYTDSVGELAERARKFARRLEGRFGLPVDMVDERLSSFEAKQTLRERGHGGDYKTAPADSLAAELILRTWLQP